MATVNFTIVTAPTAITQLAAFEIKIRRQIARKIDSLETAPDHRGKPLQYALIGYRSIKSARFRVIYQVSLLDRTVNVVCVGIRKDGSKSDVYRIAERMLSRGELGK